MLRPAALLLGADDRRSLLIDRKAVGLHPDLGHGVDQDGNTPRQALIVHPLVVDEAVPTQSAELAAAAADNRLQLDRRPPGRSGRSSRIWRASALSS